MGTRTTWLACLVVAGLMATPARAQFGPGEPVPSPDLPLPLVWGDTDEGPFFWAQGRAMRMNNPLGNQPLVFRGLIDSDGQISGRAGGFLGSGQVALVANQAAREQWEPAYEFGIGYRFRNDIVVEFSFWNLIENRSTASAGIIPPGFNVRRDFSNSFLTAPFFNFSLFFAGPTRDVLSQVSGAEVPAFGSFNGAEDVSIQLQQQAYNWEINARVPCSQTDCTRTYSMFGFRVLQVEEHFKFRIADFDLDGAISPENVVVFRNQWENRLLGLQAGMGTELYLGGGFAISGEARGGVFADLRKTKVSIERGDRGFHDVTNATKHKDTGFSPMFQVGAYLWWYPIQGIQVRAGYEFTGLFNVLRTSFPVDFNVGTLTPHFEETFLRFDGFSLGIAFIF